MRISELALLADVTIPTVKFYLRQGLLTPGVATSPTHAEYDQDHLDRLRLIRALVDVADLPLSVVRPLLVTLDAQTAAAPAKSASRATRTTGSPKPAKAAKSAPAKPTRTTKAAAAAERALALRAVGAAQEALPPQVPARRGHAPNRAMSAVTALGWTVDTESLALRQLEAALLALDILGLAPSISTLLAYAESADRIAKADVAAIPPGATADVVRHLVLATVMYEPVLLAMHRLAQQNALLTRP